MLGFVLFIALLAIVCVSGKNVLRNLVVFQGLFFGGATILYMAQVISTAFLPLPLALLGITVSVVAFLPPIRRHLNF